jgi:hypothetical protein
MIRSLKLSAAEHRPLHETDFCAWASQAEAGEALEYHRGFLVIDRSLCDQMCDPEARRQLVQTSNRALKLEAQGYVHLVQRRLGPGCFSYLAIARPRRLPQVPSFFLLLNEAA